MAWSFRLQLPISSPDSNMPCLGPAPSYRSRAASPGCPYSFPFLGPLLGTCLTCKVRRGLPTRGSVDFMGSPCPRHSWAAKLGPARPQEPSGSPVLLAEPHGVLLLSHLEPGAIIWTLRKGWLEQMPLQRGQPCTGLMRYSRSNEWPTGSRHHQMEGPGSQFRVCLGAEPTEPSVG